MANSLTTAPRPTAPSPTTPAAKPAKAEAPGVSGPERPGLGRSSIDTLNGLAKRMQRTRFISGLISFVAVVLVPLLIAGFYLFTTAEDQYATEFNFAVRGRADLASGGDGLGIALGGANALASFGDSFIVVDYMESIDAVRELEKRVGLREIYAKAGGDWFHNFATEGPIEDLRDFWRWKIHAEFDITRGIISAKVWAFDKEDSLKVATEVLTLARELVEKISREARTEALAFADKQVDDATARLTTARERVEAFRTKENVIDPTADVRRIYEQITLIEQKLIELRGEREAVVAAQGANAPRARQIASGIAALEKQLKQVEDKIDDRLPELSRQYEALISDLEIAKQSYASALQARQQAEAIATQRQVYLSVYDPPALAESSLYPLRPWLLVYIFAGLTVVWGIGYIVVLNIRDAMV